ncbi:MAG: ABC transporter substrate-binding protein, partial [Acidimicrobiaceae bacterium]|nr:ABC transporter substrate-binding protein [Acidimicrobiaceae bacterium]
GNNSRGVEMARSGLAVFRGTKALIALCVVVILGMPATAIIGSPSAAAASSGPHRGGTMTVFLNSGDLGTWANLDPPLDPAPATDGDLFMAITGSLFEQGSKGAIIPDLATGYRFSDQGKTVTIGLRKGVTFSDGTPFNAQAVAYNINRDLNPKYACDCDIYFPVSSITTPDNYTVALHLTKPFSPIISAFPGATPNYIISPTALSKTSEKDFSLKPVGAGPFEVVSNTPNSTLVLKRNPNYWQKGHPYLNGLVFKSVGSDESAYDALVSNEAQMEEQVVTYSVVQTAKKQHLKVTTIPSGGSTGIQLNTAVAPFNNVLAREAVYYATDPQPINKALIGGTGTVSQSGDGPGSLFPNLKVPGYRSYNLAKAKELVKQLGGLSFNYGTGQGAATQQAEALQAQWQAAGMHVTLSSYDLIGLVHAFHSNKWQALSGGGGGTDPAIGPGSMGWRFYSTGPFTGVHDTHLDAMIDQAASVTSSSARAAMYKKIYEYVSQQAYEPFLYAAPFYNMSLRSVHGPGIDSPILSPLWEGVWMS